MVVIDEATQATEPSTLIALTKGAHSVVLAGDPLQVATRVRGSQRTPSPAPIPLPHIATCSSIQRHACNSTHTPTGGHQQPGRNILRPCVYGTGFPPGHLRPSRPSPHARACASPPPRSCRPPS